MATKAHHRSRRSRRVRRIRKTFCGQWLVCLLARSLVTVFLMLVARWLHLPAPGAP